MKSFLDFFFTVPTDKEELFFWLLLWVINVSLVAWIITLVIHLFSGKPMGTQSRRKRRRNRRVLLYILLAYAVGIGITLHIMGASLKDTIVVPIVLAVVGGLRVLLNWERFRHNPRSRKFRKD